ncbi:O-antigen polymerase [Pigmentiphaga daeguensis]|uniref:O-antigen polymerase n=1 Tax=Pigmentiphaga daeguensis TaxID=414049 RepID=UPI0031E244A0
MKRWYQSPLVLYGGVWLFVIFLYSLHLSGLVSFFSTWEITKTIAIFLVPFVLGYAIVAAGYRALGAGRYRRVAASVGRLESPEILLRRLYFLTWLFALLVAFEIAVAGYVPLLSLLTGSSVSHFEFGISSLHGFVMALGALIATAAYYLYLQYGVKKCIWLVLAILAVFIALVTRKIFVVIVLQMGAIYIYLRGIKSPRRLLAIGVLILCAVYVFGLVGDLRGPRENFLSLARPTFKYPDWLPSGFMWVYIYIVTPIVNFANALKVVLVDDYNFGFLCQVIPSVVRGEMNCVSEFGRFERPYQVSGAFNVATGYIGLYSSLDVWGVMGFSFFHGIAASFIYKKLSPHLKPVLLYSVVMQLTLLQVFSPLFNLNVLAQIPLIYMAFSWLNFRFRMHHSVRYSRAP